MARRRMLDPNFWQSEDVSKLNIQDRLLLLGLVSNADDEGKLRGNPAFIRSTVFPYDDIPTSEIEEGLDAIEGIGTIIQYEVEGSKYIKLVNWKKFQRVDKPQPSIIPDHIESDENNGSENGSKNGSKNGSRLKEVKRSKEKLRELKHTSASADLPHEPNGSADSVQPSGGAQSETGKGQKAPAEKPEHNEYPDEFESFWGFYPRRIEKRAAYKAWKARLKEGTTPDELVMAAKHYGIYCRTEETQQRYMKHPSTFLGPNKPFEEFIRGAPVSVNQGRASPNEPKGYAAVRSVANEMGLMGGIFDDT